MWKPLLQLIDPGIILRIQVNAHLSMLSGWIVNNMIVLIQDIVIGPQQKQIVSRFYWGESGTCNV